MNEYQNLSIVKIVRDSFFLVGLLFSFNMICAQKKTSATPEERATKITEWMKSNLKLNDDQVTKAQTINLKYANKNQGLQTQAMSRKQKMQELKDNDKAKDAELKDVLTTDQYNTYQAKKDEIRKQMKEKMREKKTHNKMT